MKKYYNQQKIISIALILGLLLILGFGVYADVADPGSESDPLVTQSYVTDKLSELTKSIEENNKVILGKLESIPQNSGSSKYVVVNVKNGQQLICGESTQIILRAGNANIIGSAGGGISDLTVGNDIKNSIKVPLNHLLLIPKSDGRGVLAKSDIVILVNGAYEIR